MLKTQRVLETTTKDGKYIGYGCDIFNTKGQCFRENTD